LVGGKMKKKMFFAVILSFSFVFSMALAQKDRSPTRTPLGISFPKYPKVFWYFGENPNCTLAKKKALQLCFSGYKKVRCEKSYQEVDRTPCSEPQDCDRVPKDLKETKWVNQAYSTFTLNCKKEKE
jgi:hypothetical protein